MYQRSNVLHERQDDNLQFSVPILIGGRWVRCDRGRRLFSDASTPVTNQIVADLLKRESDNCEKKWNFNFLTEKPASDGDWEWIPREDLMESGAEEENETDDADEDDDDLQEVVGPSTDSDDDSGPQAKRSPMITIIDALC